MRAFYDELAEEYHLMFRDWDVSMEYQASVLSSAIENGAEGSVRRVPDCSCGIGTRAIGLARAGGAGVGPAQVSEHEAGRAIVF